MPVRTASQLRAPWWRPRRGPVGLTLFAVVGAVAACNWITAPLPPNAEQFAPPAVYARWWAMTEACSGHLGNLAAVQWYRAPGPEFMHNGQDVAGYWSSGGNRVVLAEEYIDRGATVRHEMLHALLRTGGHPRSQFLGACAPVVLCQGVCVVDGGDFHPSRDHIVLPPDSLAVGARAELLPSEVDGQRWLALHITVENPRARAVVVAAPGDPVTPPTFGYDLRGPSGGISGNQVATDSSTLFFQPFETKQWLFEFRVAADLSDYHISPGKYRVRGGYAGSWTAYDTIAVSP